ncbi:Bacterial regulatory proteins, tetR family [Buttiauxella agrestis]|uniref:Bacterial regulatory proteins, tetR family n=1 Tax=Buttiauxella agrestis TaxID=82977 RepID=A0A381C9P5_9ENTR|nr:TetR/AcrR family transcriptional regulator [Buttiauxella agrestis]SUW63723.1 Bacterial regulatory proteins, tetR family [Buttiauxella agrestis]
MSTYNNLLDLADTLIQENGYAGFSYADLAERMGIRKASIHHHFPSKTDLGLAYCDKKTTGFHKLKNHIDTLPAGRTQLLAYLDAFSECVEKKQMCGVYAMLSDSNLFTPELQEAVSLLAKVELRILSDILEDGREAGQLHFQILAEDMAVIVCNAFKGALMLNRTAPYEIHARTKVALLQMLITE